MGMITHVRFSMENLMISPCRISMENLSGETQWRILSFNEIILRFSKIQGFLKIYTKNILNMVNADYPKLG
jgi:hypothetical protein